MSNKKYAVEMRMALAFFILLIISNTSFSNGGRLKRSPIVSGISTKPGEFKYLVAIKYGDSHYPCGGGIINDRYVITAAHCFEKDGKFLKGPFKVVAGTNDLKNCQDLKRIEVDVEKVYMPDDYSTRKSTFDDIAVVKLKQSLEVEKNDLQKLRVPSKPHYTYEGESAVIAGFGWDEITVTSKRDGSFHESGSRTGRSRWAMARVWSKSECEKRERKILHGSYLCANVDQWSKRPYGTCSGDSGSPLVYKGEVIIGVLAASPPGCNEIYFSGQYTRITYYLSFIENALKDRTHGINTIVY